VNQYGADLLRRAVNAGYEEGFNAGQADRQDGWQFDPDNCDAYSDASYGYDGYYVDVTDISITFVKAFAVVMKTATTAVLNTEATRAASSPSLRTS